MRTLQQSPFGQTPKGEFWVRTLFFVALLLLILALFFTKLNSGVALFLGFVFVLTIGNPFPKKTANFAKMLLKISVVGLGFGLNAEQALAAGREGFGLTLLSIFLTLFLGLLLGKWLKVEFNLTYLLSAGTAICGGSAIAAISPLLAAKEQEISVAMGVVFLLNALALFIFPFIGHYLEFSEPTFGLWAAIAIHDTSSVVGAASSYGQQALQVATTVKLMRALWIIPLSFLTLAIVARRKKEGDMPKKAFQIDVPYFIGFFVLAILLNSYHSYFLPDAMQPFFAESSQIVLGLAKKALALTLFLIGLNLSYDKIKAVGFRPLLLALLLWLIISVGAAWFLQVTNSL
ncbi:YeiH family protein [Hugenholtzia roseola]|uniref:YeiH family protein n=1 Tax=Hugenholtzia roseola TaxID=1002 RepID=UPI000400F23F|nr:putative sulfate exporter family transporter [Hugenholtzia roseola]